MGRLLLKISLIYLLCCFHCKLHSFSYEQFRDGWFTTIYIITVDPLTDEIALARNSGIENHRETVKVISSRQNAIAAVNGGFWHSDGSPAGILKISGVWYGLPTKPRGAFGWSDGGSQVLIDQVRTNPEDLENQSAIRVFPQSKPPYTYGIDWDIAENIVGGVPVLVRNSKVVQDFSSERALASFIEKRHSRTAVGVREDSQLVLAVVEGAFYGLLGGMTIPELAQKMRDFGCVDALNLDGGASSTMVVENVVVNNPYGTFIEDGKRVQEVSDAILVFSRPQE